MQTCFQKKKSDSTRNAPAADVDVRGVPVLRAVRRRARVGRAEARLFWGGACQEDTYVHRYSSGSRTHMYTDIVAVAIVVVPGVRSRARRSVAP
jgi:hypothetical protein